MSSIEVITDPVSTISMLIVVLVSVTALTFIFVLVSCGFTLEELEDIDEKPKKVKR